MSDLSYNELKERVVELEKQLHEYEASFKNLFEKIPDNLFLYDLSGNVVEANRQACEHYGYSCEDMKKKNVWELVTEEYHEALRIFKKTLEETGHACIETVDVKNDASTTYIESHGVLFDYKGAKHWLAIDRDITGRKNVEKALRNSEYRYRELFSNMSSGVAIGRASHDGSDFIIKDINKAGEHIADVKRDDIIGKNAGDVFPGIKEMGLFHVLQRVNQAGIPERHANAQYIDDRLSLWVEYNVYKLPSGEIVIVFNDITSRKIAEKELQWSEKSLKNAQKFSHLGSWEMNVASGESYWSDEFFRICGYEPGEIEPTLEAGMNLTHPDDVEKAKKAVQDALGNDAKYEIEKRIVRPDGEIRHVISQGEVILDKKNKPEKIVGSFLDITERKNAELEREHLITELKKALQQLKQLKGFIPICSSCKKIRNDKGFWEQVETYIEDHSDATFSHGVCPDCVEKLYPEYKAIKGQISTD